MARRLTVAITIVVLLAIWQMVALGPMSDSPFPSATSTLGALGTAITQPTFWQSVAATLVTAAVGLGLAVLVAVPLGVGLGTSHTAYRAARVVVEFLKPIPPIVILPLVVLVLGPTTRMGVFLVFFGCLFPVLTQTITGVHDADPVALDTARSFGLSRPSRMARIVLPGALAFIATGIRISAGAAIIIAVVSELIGGAPGLGKDLFIAQSAGLYPELYAYVLFLGIAGVGVNVALAALEHRLLHWHPSVRGEFA